MDPVAGDLCQTAGVDILSHVSAMTAVLRGFIISNMTVYAAGWRLKTKQNVLAARWRNKCMVAN